MAVLALMANGAMAQQLTPKERERRPGAAAAAALVNVVFVPVRLVMTLVGAELGGLVGFLNAGDTNAANDVWHLFRGHDYITPAIADGDEALRIGDLQLQAQ
jgi:hypothetical protein